MLSDCYIIRRQYVYCYSIIDRVFNPSVSMSKNFLVNSSFSFLSPAFKIAFSVLSGFGLAYSILRHPHSFIINRHVYTCKYMVLL